MQSNPRVGSPTQHSSPFHSGIMATNAAHEYKSIYINGNWHASLSGQHLDIVNPADEVIIGRAPAGGASDIEAAVGAARAAFDARGEGSWASWTS